MKKLFVLFSIGAALVTIAATNPPVTPPGLPIPSAPVHVLPNADSIANPPSNLTLLIAVAIPALIAGLKQWAPKLPGWSLPIIAPALGALSDYVMQLSGVSTNGVAVGALLGSAGVGLRELHDQLKQKIGPDSPPKPPVATPPTTP